MKTLILMLSFFSVSSVCQASVYHYAGEFQIPTHDLHGFTLSKAGWYHVDLNVTILDHPAAKLSHSIFHGGDSDTGSHIDFCEMGMDVQNYMQVTGTLEKEWFPGAYLLGTGTKESASATAGLSLHRNDIIDTSSICNSDIPPKTFYDTSGASPGPMGLGFKNAGLSISLIPYVSSLPVHAELVDASSATYSITAFDFDDVLNHATSIDPFDDGPLAPAIWSYYDQPHDSGGGTYTGYTDGVIHLIRN